MILFKIIKSFLSHVELSLCVCVCRVVSFIEIKNSSVFFYLSHVLNRKTKHNILLYTYMRLHIRYLCLHSITSLLLSRLFLFINVQNTNNCSDKSCHSIRLLIVVVVVVVVECPMLENRQTSD